ncbi:MAG: IMPACT family protein [Gammaproteobacteria bacterium]
MHCVKHRRTIEENVKKSRFIGIVIPCAGEKDVFEALQQVQRDCDTADHIAFAYRILTASGLAVRFYDAGEPSGTAGKPILQHLEGKNLVNVLVVVVRYFGGVKLGAGGLTRAYGTTAKRAIEAGEICEFVILERIRLELPYNRLQKLEYLLTKLEARIVEQSFAEQVALIVELPAVNKDKLVKELAVAY